MSLDFGTPSKNIERRYLPEGANVLLRGNHIESWSLPDSDRHARQAAKRCARERFPRSRDAQHTYARLLVASARDDDDPSWGPEFRADLAAIWSGIAADDARWLACRAAVRRLRAELAMQQAA
jgi:hypothetical protein